MPPWCQRDARSRSHASGPSHKPRDGSRVYACGSARRCRASSMAAVSGVIPARARRRRSRAGCRRSRGPAAGDLRVVARPLELDGDVDDAAGVGHEVRRPQDPAPREEVGDARRRRAGCSPRRRSTGACRRGTVSSLSTPPSAQGASTSTCGGQRLGRARSSARRASRPRALLRWSMSETTSFAPRLATSCASRRPTLPRPTTATRAALQRRCRRTRARSSQRRPPGRPARCTGTGRPSRRAPARGRRRAASPRR